MAQSSGLYLAAVEEGGGQEETREKEPVFPTRKPQGQGKWHSQEAQKGEAWSCARGETLLTFSSRGGLCINDIVTTLQGVARAPGVVRSATEPGLENSTKAQLSSGERGDIPAPRPYLPSFPFRLCRVTLGPCNLSITSELTGILRSWPVVHITMKNHSG